MKLTTIRPVGRYINPETGNAVNVKKGRQVGRSTDVYFYLYMNQRVFISAADFSNWEKV